MTPKHVLWCAYCGRMTGWSYYDTRLACMGHCPVEARKAARARAEQRPPSKPVPASEPKKQSRWVGVQADLHREHNEEVRQTRECYDFGLKLAR